MSPSSDQRKRVVSDENSRVLENPMLDGLSHQNMLNESGDSEMLNHRAFSLKQNN